MSYNDGNMAINLEMPGRVPRTEYSADMHWGLIAKVTGIQVGAFSDDAAKTAAGAAFIRAWDYSFIWSILTHNQAFGEKRSRMGHAVYQDGQIDFDDKVSLLYETPEDALTFDPWELYGAKDKRVLTAEYNMHYKANCARNPDAVNMTGIYVTCMSGLIEIFGWEILLETAGASPKGFGALTNRYAEWIMQYFQALAMCDSPTIMIHDDIVWTSGAFIHPDWYRTYVFPNYKKLFAPLIENGKKIIYTSDGNYSEFIDDIAGCGVNGFVLEPCTDMGYMANKYGNTHVIIGNADTRVLKYGTKDDIFAEVKRCMDIGKQCPGYFLAVGNHIPPDTPVDSALYYNDAYEKMSRR